GRGRADETASGGRNVRFELPPDLVDLVRVLEAVGGVRALDAAIVAEERPALVAPEPAQVPGQDAGAVAEVVLDLVQVVPALRPAACVRRHDLHEAAGADRARGARPA